MYESNFKARIYCRFRKTFRHVCRDRLIIGRMRLFPVAYGSRVGRDCSILVKPYVTYVETLDYWGTLPFPSNV